MEIFLFYNKMGKKQGNKKSSCYVKGERGSLVLMCSPEVEVGNDLRFRFMPLGVPPSEERTRTGTSLTT
jgi:hypothetical protein